ncbi:uncharacterized protein LOC114297885 [Camellia sinensis]|uniref:uncharacterized protein LOC114297885 n=1 Tax=Camellia sinensis TaxID=4442 RepID=UPI0010368B89|nr:uncharacterized protein LOC114297885 [Camellia sinensis]
MKILSWNVRGLGRVEKRRRIKEVLKEKKVDMAMLQETKKSEVDDIFVRSLWPNESMEFMGVDAEDSAGALLCIWKPEVFALKDCCSSRRFILLLGNQPGVQS